MHSFYCISDSASSTPARSLVPRCSCGWRKSHQPPCWSFFFLIFNFIYFWLRWVLIAVHGLSLVVASGGYSSLQCTGFSLQWLLLLQSVSSRLVGFSSCGMWAQQLWHVGSVVTARGLQSAGSVVVAHGLSCSVAREIFPDQGLNSCPLRWQADSYPLRHRGRLSLLVFYRIASCAGHTCPRSLGRETGLGPGGGRRWGDLGLNSLQRDREIKEKGMEKMDKAILSCCVPPPPP